MATQNATTNPDSTLFNIPLPIRSYSRNGLWNDQLLTTFNWSLLADRPDSLDKSSPNQIVYRNNAGLATAKYHLSARHTCAVAGLA